MLGYPSAEDLIARVSNAADLHVSPAQRDGAVASVAAGASGPDRRAPHGRTRRGRPGRLPPRAGQRRHDGLARLRVPSAYSRPAGVGGET